MKTGNVEIVLPRKEQVSIGCFRVAVLRNGEFVLEDAYLNCDVDLNAIHTAEQLEKAAERIEAYANNCFLIETNKEGVAKIENLEEGVYLLDSVENASQGNQKMLPTLLYVPTWDEAEEKMMYDITLIPKYGSDEPSTGDSTDVVGLSILFVISAVILGYKFKKTRKKEECF